MKTQVHKIVQVAHIELEPVERCVQIYLQPMANDVELLSWFYLRSFSFNLKDKESWKSFDEYLSYRLVIHILFPLIPNSGVFR